MKNYLLLCMGLILMSGCASIRPVSLYAVTDCKYDTTYQITAYRTIDTRQPPIVIQKSKVDNCDPECCNTILVQEIAYNHRMQQTLFHGYFYANEIMDNSIEIEGCWFVEGSLCVWLTPMHEGIPVYRTATSIVPYMRLNTEYYKGILLDIFRNRVLLRICALESDGEWTGWVNIDDYICSSGNGEC